MFAAYILPTVSAFLFLAPFADAGCPIERNVNYPGNDIGKAIEKRSSQECRKACNSMRTCGIWVFRRNDSQCWLKTSGSLRSKTTFRAAGLESGKACSGNGCSYMHVFIWPGSKYNLEKKRNISPSKCSHLCKRNKKCKYWVHNGLEASKPASKCILKSTEAPDATTINGGLATKFKSGNDIPGRYQSGKRGCITGQ